MIIPFDPKLLTAVTRAAAIMAIAVAMPYHQANAAENATVAEWAIQADGKDQLAALDSLEGRIGAVEAGLEQLARAQTTDGGETATVSSSGNAESDEQNDKALSLFAPMPETFWSVKTDPSWVDGRQLAQAVTPKPPVPVAPGGRGSSQTARPKSEKGPDQLLVEAGGVLLRAGTVQIEPSIEYGHFSATRLSINGLIILEGVAVIGTIRADDIDRDVVTGALTGRVGIFNRLQMDVRVPYVWREDTETFNVGSTAAFDRQNSNHGIGDVQAGLSAQLLLGRGSIPAVILRLDGTFPTGDHPFEIEREPVPGAPGDQRLIEPPTGSGFYQAGANLTFVWTSDPVVFFGGGGYTYTFERDFNEFGNIDPGDNYRFFAGMNVALSDRVSLNVSFTDQITGRTEQNGNKAPNSAANDARLIVGTSIGMSSSTSLLVAATAGLTDQAPDFAFSISLPITF